jgi:hypothetical protein
MSFPKLWNASTRYHLLVGVVGLSTVFQFSDAAASECIDEVKSIMADTRGRVLSVTAEDGDCHIVFLQQHEGRRPERIVIELPGSPAAATFGKRAGSRLMGNE